MSRNLEEYIPGLKEDGINTAENINTTGSFQVGGVSISATPAEINRAADTSGRLVAVGAALTATEAAHDGKILLLNTAANSVVTLPAASGSGVVITCVVTVKSTGTGHVIKVANASDTMKGSINILDLDSSAQAAFAAAATSDTITLNGTTTGGQIGDIVKLYDALANVWLVEGMLQCPAGSNPATMFSAAVS